MFRSFFFEIATSIINHEVDSLINTTADTVEIALCFELCLGVGLKEIMDSSGHCVVER